MPIIEDDEYLPVYPSTDPEWSKVSDEQLDTIKIDDDNIPWKVRQRANSERIARAESARLRDKMERLKNGGRKERLAINIPDATRISDVIRPTLLGDKIDPKQPIWIDKNKGDEIGALFICDLLTAATICDIIRTHDIKAGDYPTRVYLKKESAWTKCPQDMIFTIVRDGEVVLNPNVFLVEVEREVFVPKDRKKIVLQGRKQKG